VAEADSPGLSAGDDVAAGVDAEAPGTSGGELAGGLRDRPSLHVAGGVESSGRSNGEEAAGVAAEVKARRENRVDEQFHEAQLGRVRHGHRNPSTRTAAQAFELQGNDPKSFQISSSAEPILQQEVLTDQTAAVDAVSGATFTSASYEQSLQSALDKLGFKAADGSRATLQIPADGGDRH
jgi:FMN-binding domain